MSDKGLKDIDFNKALQDPCMEGKEEIFSIEDAISRLEEIAENLEAPEIGLKESLDIYTEGVTLIKRCKEHLMDVEKEMLILEHEGETSDK